MATNQYERFTFTSPVRMVWPSLITPKPAHTHNGIHYKSQYEAKFLFTPDHPDLPELRRLLAEIAMNAFGTVDIKKFPIEAGDPVADEGQRKVPPQDREYFRGMGVMTAHSGVTKADGQPAKPPVLMLYDEGGNYRVFGDSEREAAKQFFYPGVEVLGEVSFMPYQPPMGPGISAFLNEIVSMNRGVRLAGGFDPAAKYGAAIARHVGQTTQVDPTTAAHVVSAIQHAGAGAKRVPF